MSASIRVSAHGFASWSALQVSLDVPTNLPLFDTLASVTADVEFRSDLTVASSGTFTSESVIVVDLEGPENLPELFGLTFDRHLRVEAALTAGTAGGVTIGGELSIFTRVRLPAPPEAPFVTLTPGDPGGWIGVSVHAAAQAGAAGDEIDVDVTLSDVGRLDVFLVGLARDPPPLSATIASISGSVTIAAPPNAPRSVTGTLATDVLLRAHPQLDPSAPRALELADSLLGAIDIDVGTTLTVTIAHEDGQQTLRLAGQFWNWEDRSRPARVDVDVFGLLRQLTSSGPTVIGEGSSFRIAADFAGFALDLGAEPSISVGFGVAIGNTAIPLYVAFSKTSLSFGMGAKFESQEEVAIPLFLRPKIDAATIAALRAAEEDLCEPIREALSDQGRINFEKVTATVWDTIAFLGGGSVPPSNAPPFYTAIEDPVRTWQLIAPDGREPIRSDMPIQVALGFTASDQAVLVGRIGDGEFTPLAVDPRVLFQDFSVSIPFQNVQNMSVRGTVALEGFDGFLAPLNGKGLTLGLSADLVYFELASDPPQTFMVPAIRDYEGGRITIGTLRLGIGVPRRSFTAAFQGELVLPQQLIDDLDISDLNVPSIRLPGRASVGFRFDLTPLVLGKVIIPMPSLQFDVDLRRPGAGLAVQAGGVEPVWDGLQLIVPHVFRVSFERFSYDPMVGFYCSGNSNFQGDLQLSSGEFGITLVVEGGYWAWGIDSQCALVLMGVASIPFFDRLGLRLDIAGFGLQITLERPVPTFSPFALFEMLALVCDPVNYPVPRRGDLADMVRVTLRGAQVTLPEAAARVLPALPDALKEDLEFTINIATFVEVTQQIARTLEGVVGASANALGNAASLSPDERAEAIGRIAPNAPLIEEVARAILKLLPEPMRRWRIDGRLGGFAAEVELILAGAAELAPAATSAEPAPLPRSWDAGTTWDPFSDGASAWIGQSVSGLEVGDWRPEWGPYVLAHATIQVLPGSVASFTGFVGARGRVRMKAAVTSTAPLVLPLSFVGIDVPFNLACAGALTLDVELRTGTGDSTISGHGAAMWTVPGLLGVSVPAATATVRSDGRFESSGTGTCTLFGDAAVLEGTVHATNERIDLSQGTLVWDPLPGLSIDIHSVHGHIGPGPRFAFSGRGAVVLAGRKGINVLVHLTEEGATFEATLDAASGTGLVPGLPTLSGTLVVAGGISTGAGQVSARFACHGDVSLAAPLGMALRGQGEMRLRATGLELSMTGALVWLGRNWLGAELDISTDRGVATATVRGVTNVSIEPERPVEVKNLFIDAPHLSVIASLKCEATLTLAKGVQTFTSAAIGGSLTLAAHIGEQDFPIAAFGGEWSLPAPSEDVDVVVVRMPGIQLFPFSLEVPIPDIDWSSQLRFSKTSVAPISLSVFNRDSGALDTVWPSYASDGTDTTSLSIIWPRTKEETYGLNGSPLTVTVDVPDLDHNQELLRLGTTIRFPFCVGLWHGDAEQWRLPGTEWFVPDSSASNFTAVPLPRPLATLSSTPLPVPTLGLPSEPLDLVLTLGGTPGLRLWWRLSADDSATGRIEFWSDGLIPANGTRYIDMLISAALDAIKAGRYGVGRDRIDRLLIEITIAPTRDDLVTDPPREDALRRADLNRYLTQVLRHLDAADTVRAVEVLSTLRSRLSSNRTPAPRATQVGPSFLARLPIAAVIGLWLVATCVISILVQWAFFSRN